MLSRKIHNKISKYILYSQRVLYFVRERWWRPNGGCNLFNLTKLRCYNYQQKANRHMSWFGPALRYKRGAAWSTTQQASATVQEYHRSRTDRNPTTMFEYHRGYYLSVCRVDQKFERSVLSTIVILISICNPGNSYTCIYSKSYCYWNTNILGSCS